ncbi:hypothetical protein [Streptomyces sp. NPDC089915]|uniref:hypothetical protein n=1 Tax=Streptomyces sp. NPDC089915 TaxID=3155186 RepID=UPI00341836E8
MAEPKDWLVGRTGDHVNSVSSSEADLPADVTVMPRLESDFIADSVGPTIERLWYLPEFTLFADVFDEDPDFAFDADQNGDPAPDGGPFNHAVLTLGLDTKVPEHLASDEGASRLNEVPDLDPGVTLIVPVTQDDGTVKENQVKGATKIAGEVGFIATFELTGSLVEATYTHLTRRGKLRLDFEPTYSGYVTTLVNEPDTGFPVHGSIFHGFQFQVFGDAGNTPGGEFEPVLSHTTRRYVFFPSTARFHRTLPIGVDFNTDTYRSRFTITAEGMTRPIIDVNDLNTFAGQRSEYRELTTLGDIATKYPSLRRIFFGQVSGTVIAVPADYGVLITAQGALASCDSIVDESPTSFSGCRFHFTFTVAPMADPIDLARLRADVPGIPEAIGRTLRVALPGGLDSRTPSTLDGFPAGRAAFADGDATAVQVGIDIADDRPTPATTTVNLFLQQLAATGPPPLFGSIAVRLDDVFPQPVRTSLLLNMRHTAHGDDLATTPQPGPPPSATAVNQGPLDLKLLSCADVREGQEPAPVVSLGGLVLAARQTTTLPGVGAATEVAVSRALEVAVPLPKAQMLKFLAFHTHTVQEVQHPLTVNAAGLDFAAEGIGTIRVDIILTSNPGVSAPSFTLSQSHTVDFVHVSVPVDSAVTGLDSTVSLTLTTTSNPRTVSVKHDFVDEPILVVTSSTIH